MKLSAHLRSYERLRTNKDVTNAHNHNPKEPAASQRVEVEVTPETKVLPPLPSSLDASSEDEECMERLIPDGGMAPTIEDAAPQEFEAAILWKREKKVQLVLEVKDQENKSEEIAEHWQQQNAHDERNRRNTSTLVQEILNVNITNVIKYGPDYSRRATNYGPIHDNSRHSTQNETYTDHAYGQYVGTSDRKPILRAPPPNSKC